MHKFTSCLHTHTPKELRTLLTLLDFASRLSSENSVRSRAATMFDYEFMTRNNFMQNVSGTRLKSIQQNSDYVCFPAVPGTSSSHSALVASRVTRQAHEAAAALFCCLAS